MENEFWYLPWLFIVILLFIVGLVFAIVGIVKHNNKKQKKNKDIEQFLKYSDKVKNYHGKNVETNPENLSSKYYDENGKRKIYCADSEQFFTGTSNYLFETDQSIVIDFVKYVFHDFDSDDNFINEKVNRIYNSKENKGDTLIDIRYFFKNPRYIILPFHITPDARSQMILYYCQTRAEKCIMMPITKYSSKNTNNYLAYFPLDSFDDMCFISYLMVKYPMQKGLSIHGFESGFWCQNLDKYEHDKDFVFEYIYRMIIDYKCKYFPMANAFAETNERVLKVPGYPDASKYSSKQAEIKAEMQKEGLIKSGLHNENERKLFFLIKESYPDAIYQYRDEWLGYYSLDIYIPSLKIAIEYQGGQHYKSINFYGGEKTFKDNQRRDKNKKELCLSHGVKLIEWKYDMPINQNSLSTMLKTVYKQ